MKTIKVELRNAMYYADTMVCKSVNRKIVIFFRTNVRNDIHDISGIIAFSLMSTLYYYKKQ